MSQADKKYDEQLEMLLTDPNGATPPEGLLGKLLSDIPDDLGFEWQTDDDSEDNDAEKAIGPQTPGPQTPGPTVPVPANDDGPRYWRWAVAATVVLALGIGSIMFRYAEQANMGLSEMKVETFNVPVGADMEAGAFDQADEVVAQAKEIAQQPSIQQADSRAMIPDIVSEDMEFDDAGTGERRQKSRDHARQSRVAQGGTLSPQPEPIIVGRNEALKQELSRRLQAAPPSDMATEPAPRIEEQVGNRKDGTSSQASLFEVAERPRAEGESKKIAPMSPAPAPASAKPMPPPQTADADRLRSLGYVGTIPAPVNEQAFADNYFQSEDSNPFIDTDDDALSTFGLDVDTGSYSVVREYLRRGHLPPHAAVRVEEMVNYFDYGDSPPQDGEGDFAIHTDGARSIYGEGERYYLLRIGIKGREVDAAKRKPALLTFVIDVSGSMGRDDRLGLVKQSLSLLLDQLRDSDRMALVVYGSRGRVVLEPTSDREAIRRAIAGLRPEGSTNAGEGLALAYELAARFRKPGEINRLILCSDGVANVGKTSARSILDDVKRHADQGVELTTVGFGMGNYNDVLMEQLANNGNGRYAYVDTLVEARKIFVENLTGTLQTIAAEARAQVELNPDLVARYRLLGYENRDIADERFRDDTVDAGEIGAGHTVTVLYELKTKRPLKKRDRVATVHLRYASIAQGKMVEQDHKIYGRDFAKSWEATPKAFRLAALVGELAEILRGSYWARTADPRDVFIRLQKVAADFPGDTEIAELATLAGKAADLKELEKKQTRNRQ